MDEIWKEHKGWAKLSYSVIHVCLVEENTYFNWQTHNLMIHLGNLPAWIFCCNEIQVMSQVIFWKYKCPNRQTDGKTDETDLSTWLTRKAEQAANPQHREHVWWVRLGMHCIGTCSVIVNDTNFVFNNTESVILPIFPMLNWDTECFGRKLFFSFCSNLCCISFVQECKNGRNIFYDFYTDSELFSNFGQIYYINEFSHIAS